MPSLLFSHHGMYIMNREELKKHITNFRLNLPQGIKFAVIAQSTAVLESAKDLHCEYLYVAMDRQGYAWARMTYGEMETRLEGTWIGNSWLKVYPCYDDEHLVMLDGIPCQYVGETHPFQDDPTLERPVPKLEDFLTETPGQRRFRESMPEGYNKREDERAHELAMRGRDLPKLMLTGKNVDVADAVGDYLGLEDIAVQAMESRSASKSLLQNPTSLKDTPYSQPQRWKRGLLRASEYRAALRDSENQLKMTDDPKQNRRRYNSASLKNKVTFKRRLKSWTRALERESLTARCIQPPGGHIEPEDHTVDAAIMAVKGSGLLRKQLKDGGK